MMASWCPAVQQSFWLRRVGALVGAFEAVVHHIAHAVLIVVINISGTSTGIAEIVAAVRGSCGGSKPEDEHQGVEDNLTP